MPLTAIITHRPDTAVLQCHGDIDQLFHCVPDQLVGKQLWQAGIRFIRPDESELGEDEHLVHLIATGRQQRQETIVGVRHKTSQPPVWMKAKAYSQVDARGQLQRIVTIYSALLSGSNSRDLPAPLQIEDDWSRTFDALDDVVTILSPDLLVVRANKATATTFEIPHEELIGRPCYEVFHDKSEPCSLCPAWQHDRGEYSKCGLVYHDRTKKTFEVRSSPVFDDKGNLKHLVHSARDVTQQLKDEKQRSILSAAVEQASDAIMLTSPEGIIRYVNPSYCRNSGYERDELIGRNLRRHTMNTDNIRLYDEIFATVKNGRAWKGLLETLRKDGSLLQENATFSPITDNNGNIINLVAVKRDITKEEQLQNQLRQAMKMEAIGTLAGGIAHDFNNILAAMIGYGQIALGKLEHEDPLKGDIEQILEAGDRAANLVKQILTFSRRDQHDTFQPLKVQYIIKEAVKLLRSSVPTTIDIHQDIDTACPAILAEPTQMHQVIMNLCTNARQAIGDGYGTISITLKKETVLQPRLLQSVYLLSSGTYVHLAVQDNGEGMSKEIQSKIFDPFFTTKPKSQGTGLGLSVAHGIVEKHGGVIDVESREDEGTTFHIYLPVVNKPVEETTYKRKPADPMGTERLMVVDDDPPVAEMMKKMLTKLGYTVSLYTDSLAAVHDFRKHPQSYDGVITDMTMPNMTGAELTREVLSIRADLPVIMTTGYSEIIDEEKAHHIGVSSFMMKPVKKSRLAEIVRNVLDHV